MKKEKFHIEYIFDKVSRRSLWNHLTTPPGLSAWFADDVTINDNMYVFKWNRDEQEAEVLSVKPEISIRYRWADEEEENVYFEFLIHTVELTGATALEITDFAEPDEKKDSINLWDSQVEELKRTLGI
ncbi:START-like domain-containing protein [Parabacteroides chongii]|uniref:START-like domain-containing protein n=1 Tax=Parabacteroides chongii TaxID=2685834 RepID=UPI00240D48C0|nr:START-like domain-containing protein [Parabacteroides chongii]WFE86710.1 START-like domain-containing protein [Parabacteroides chongii]